MFKLFRKKQRGQSRSPKQKADEQKYKVDEMLTKIWLKDLAEHPNYAREIARQKFGLSPEPEEYGGGEAPPDLLDVLRQAKEARELVASELGEKTNIWSVVPEIMKNLPAAIQGLQQLQGGATPQKPEQRQITEPVPPPPPELSQEDILSEFVESILAMAPEGAAQELFSHKDEEGTVHALIWSTLLKSDVDSCLEMIPMLDTLPTYQFLVPYAQKLTTDAGKQWLGLLIDEINRLNSGEVAQEPAEITQEPGETEAGIEETEQNEGKTE